MVFRGGSVAGAAHTFAQARGLGLSEIDQLTTKSYEAAALQGAVTQFRLVVLVATEVEHLDEVLGSLSSDHLLGFDTAVVACVGFPAPPPGERQALGALVDSNAILFIQFDQGCDVTAIVDRSIKESCAASQAVALDHQEAIVAFMYNPLRGKSIVETSPLETDLFVGFLRYAVAVTGQRVGVDEGFPPFVLSITGHALVFDAKVGGPAEAEKQLTGTWSSALRAASLGVQARRPGAVAQWSAYLEVLGFVWEDRALSYRWGQLPLVGISKGTDRPRRAASGADALFVVLVATQGPGDSSTAGTFADVAATVASGLNDLGFEARVMFCAPLYPGSCGDLVGGDGSPRIQVYLKQPL